MIIRNKRDEFEDIYIYKVKERMEEERYEVIKYVREKGRRGRREMKTKKRREKKE